MPRKLTFDISSCKDYFEQIVLPSFEAYKNNALSYKDALSAAIFCWQFSEWIYNSYTNSLEQQLKKEGNEVKSLKEFQGILMKMQCFSFVSQIANGAKHLQCDDTRIQDITSTQKETDFYQGLLALGTATYLTINVGSNRYFFIRELQKCIDHWSIVLIQLDIYTKNDN